MTRRIIDNTVQEPQVVLTSAVCNAAERLGLNQNELADVLRISAASVSRLQHGQRSLSPKKAEHDLALLLIRLFRSLDALVGGEEASARLWMQAENRHLGGIPLKLIQSMEGLNRVVGYLDAMRGTF